jgi:GPH family glycoside/pentoside/hexuronide:cation symporter
MSETPRPRGLSTEVLLGYGVGSLGTGIYSTVPGLLLLYYMTDTLGIAAGAAGLAVFLPKFWDVVTDPAMGLISDRTRSRWGRRRPYLLAGGLALPICFALLFNAPGAGETAFFYTLGLYTLCATAFTVFSVPYIAMPAEICGDYHGSTRLMAYRMGFMTAGILIAGAGAPLLVKLGGGGRAGYAMMGWVVAAVCLVALLGAFWGTRRAPFVREVSETPTPVAAQLRVAAQNQPFRALVGAYVLQVTAVGCLLAMVPYFAKYVVGGDEDTVTLLFICLVAPAIVTMPLWLAVSRRIGKERAYTGSLLLFAAAATGLWWSPSLSFAAAAGCVAVMGTAYAATQLFPFAMLPDLQQAAAERSGLRQEGVLSGIWMAVDKGGLALGALLAGKALGWGGFIASEAGTSVVQPGSAVTAIVVAMSLAPAALCLASAALFQRYPLDRRG